MKKNKTLIIEIWNFLIERKAWWLLPIIILLFFIGILITLGTSSPISPFIYILA